jgi:hypothetical protein
VLIFNTASESTGLLYLSARVLLRATPVVLGINLINIFGGKIPPRAFPKRFSEPFLGHFRQRKGLDFLQNKLVKLIFKPAIAHNKYPLVFSLLFFLQFRSPLSVTCRTKRATYQLAGQAISE